MMTHRFPIRILNKGSLPVEFPPLKGMRVQAESLLMHAGKAESEIQWAIFPNPGHRSGYERGTT